MKIANMFAAAGLVIASLGVSTAADAQHRRGDGYRYGRGDHRYDRDHHRRWNNDRGHHYGRDRHRQRCRIEWRHHHRVRVCR